MFRFCGGEEGGVTGASKEANPIDSVYSVRTVLVVLSITIIIFYGPVLSPNRNAPEIHHCRHERTIVTGGASANGSDLESTGKVLENAA